MLSVAKKIFLTSLLKTEVSLILMFCGKEKKINVKFFPTHKCEFHIMIAFGFVNKESSISQI